MEKKHNEIEVLIEDFNNLNFAKLLQLWFNDFLGLHRLFAIASLKKFHQKTFFAKNWLNRNSSYAVIFEQIPCPKNISIIVEYARRWPCGAKAIEFINA